MTELERDREIKEVIYKMDLIMKNYKTFPHKNISQIINPMEELLAIYIEKFEASKIVVELNHLMQEAKNYDTKSTESVISYQNYRILLGKVISQLKTLIQLLKDRLRDVE